MKLSRGTGMIVGTAMPPTRAAVTDGRASTAVPASILNES
jgi:hypothetical protein